MQLALPPPLLPLFTLPHLGDPVNFTLSTTSWLMKTIILAESSISFILFYLYVWKKFFKHKYDSWNIWLTVTFTVNHYHPIYRNVKSLPIVHLFLLKRYQYSRSVLKIFLPFFWLVIMLKSNDNQRDKIRSLLALELQRIHSILNNHKHNQYKELSFIL